MKKLTYDVVWIDIVILYQVWSVFACNACTNLTYKLKCLSNYFVKQPKAEEKQ